MENLRERIYFNRVNGLRGISAIIVFLSHAIGIYETGALSKFLLFDGAAAVVLFFMLNGFSNSIKYVVKPFSRFNLVKYWITRFFRLYPPYLLSLLPILFMKKFIFKYENMIGFSDWAMSKWIEFPELNQIITFSLLKTPYDSEINSTMWPMTIIITITLIFPIVIYTLQKVSSKYGLLVVILLSYILSIIFKRLEYFPIFVIGATIASLSKEIKISTKVLDYDKIYNLLIILAAILLFNIRFIAPLFLNNVAIAEHNLIIDGVTSIGCILLIIYAMIENKFTKFLGFGFFNFMGTISYSFYLLHFPVILTVSSITKPLFNNAFLSITLSFIVSVFISYIFYKVVEIKFKGIGLKTANLLVKNNL